MRTSAGLKQGKAGLSGGVRSKTKGHGSPPGTHKQALKRERGGPTHKRGPVRNPRRG